MHWEQGRAVIDQLLEAGHLERVPPSRSQAEFMIGRARAHAAAVELVAEADPLGAYLLAYEAGRKALTAVLENQGLRPTAAGGHDAMFDAVRAQLDPPMGKVLRPFGKLRKTRMSAKFASQYSEETSPEEIAEDLEVLTDIIDTCERVLDEMGPF